MEFTRREFIKLTAGAGLAAGSLQANALAAERVTIPRRKFGRHNRTLSVVGFGGHTLYLSGSQKEANEVTARALDLGVDFFENAWDYHDGEAEVYMGNALKGRRDKLFLMSKFCIYHNGKYGKDKNGAMKMLEDTLRRLQTDHLDLWMLHNVKGNDAEKAYQSNNGALEALELARDQGKIRYVGFTGHTDPQIHIDLIKGGFEWDATLMPVSVVGALDSRDFEKEVMPLCEEKNIAVLGMKGFGGSRRTHLHERTNPKEILRYSLSYSQVCTHVIGVDKVDYVNQAVAASTATPMTPEERARFVVDNTPGSPDYYALHHGRKHYESGCCGDEHPVA